MKTKKLSTIVLTAAICFLVASPLAFAKNGNGNPGHGRGKSGMFENNQEANEKGHKKHGFSSNDRDVLRGYVIGHFKKHCPPGLAKKNPPCIPPGQVKIYDVGTTLPEETFEPLPDYIVEQLMPPPPNGRYVRVDRNVYLITNGTRKILDAIELFSSLE
ncbi:MAG: hypothetical protein PSY14_12805 [bacterium]|nr:hypothetical protein [bacterium]